MTARDETNGADRPRCAGPVDRREFVRRATLLAGGLLAAMVTAGEARADDRWDVGEVEPLAPTATLPLRRYRVPDTDGAQVDAANELLLVRWNGRVRAFALGCPHRGATLEWQPGRSTVYCPKHKARFRGDGSHAGGRATRDLDRYPIRRDGEQLVVEVATRLRADQDAAAWAAAEITL